MTDVKKEIKRLKLKHAREIKAGAVIICNSPPYYCVGAVCPKYPSGEHFAQGGSMCSGCKDYPGYGYCYNGKNGKKVEHQVYVAPVEHVT